MRKTVQDLLGLLVKGFQVGFPDAVLSPELANDQFRVQKEGHTPGAEFEGSFQGMNRSPVLGRVIGSHPQVKLEFLQGSALEVGNHRPGSGFAGIPTGSPVGMDEEVREFLPGGFFRGRLCFFREEAMTGMVWVLPSPGLHCAGGSPEGISG